MGATASMKALVINPLISPNTTSERITGMPQNKTTTKHNSKIKQTLEDYVL